MLEELKEQVCKANLQLPKYGLVTFTWGNVSGMDHSRGILAIKPSGIEYDQLHNDDIVLVDVETGKKIEGKYNPSSDTETHRALYLENGNIGGIVHTHSAWATVWAQMGMSIPAFGTTHADYFYGSIPCTRKMTAQEITGNYEWETGKVIAETVKSILNTNCSAPSVNCSAVLVHSHGPFTWGDDPDEAVEKAIVLEEVAKMAYYTYLGIGRVNQEMQQVLLNKHYFRKHGETAYYGQRGAI